jgi:hypothetical protein
MFDTACISAAGTFTFTVDSAGKVIMDEIEGTLPDTLVSIIKKNIANTSGNWKVSFQDKKRTQSKPIILVIALDVENYKNMDKCKKSERQKTMSFESYLVKIMRLMSETNPCKDQVLETGFLYIIPPVSLYYGQD